MNLKIFLELFFQIERMKSEKGIGGASKGAQKQMTTKTRKHVLSATYAGILSFATSASAAVLTLTTPPPSEYVDAESTVVLPFPTDQGRQVTLTLSAPVAPTNAIQVALGQDTNGDEDLEPEETALVMGVDCGVPFTRDEGLGRRSRSTVEFDNSASLSAGQHNEEDDHLSTPTPNTYTFSFMQPQAAAKRYDLAKVTTRNMATTNAVILADIKRPGLVLLLR